MSRCNLINKNPGTAAHVHGKAINSVGYAAVTQRLLAARMPTVPMCSARPAPAADITALKPETTSNLAMPEASGLNAAPFFCMPVSRRSSSLLLGLVSALLAEPACRTPEASASKLPAVADRAWEAMGGGPSDLFFPASFLGVWDVQSVLTSVETPLGPDFIQNKAAVDRAIKEDLNTESRYRYGRTRFARGFLRVYWRARRRGAIPAHVPCLAGRPTDSMAIPASQRPTSP